MQARALPTHKQTHTHTHTYTYTHYVAHTTYNVRLGHTGLVYRHKNQKRLTH